jgi:alpha-galactosidase
MEFTRQVVSDVVQAPALADSKFHLIDINPERLATAEGMVKSIVREAGLACPVRGFGSVDGAFEGVDFCVNAIQVGGLAATTTDFEVPERYGIHQTIADTLGIGGVFRGLRTIPAVLEIAAALHSQAPDAILLNYTNPMSMVIWALDRAFPNLQVYGLCHSVHYTAESISEYLDIPFEELEWTSAGINHMAWMLTLRHQGEDLYPRLFQAMRDPDIYRQDAVRFELMQRLGYFVTESSEHNAEYTNYFLTHPQEIERLNIPVGRYLHISQNNVDEYQSIKEQLKQSQHQFLMEPSPEYAPAFINARVSNQTWWFQGNVMNRGLIDNLPEGACVEVPVLVNQHGVFPTHVGGLPPQLAALDRHAIALQELTVQAALTKDRDMIYQAAMMDPLVSSVLPLQQIWQLVDDMIEAHGTLLPPYQSARLQELLKPAR